MSEFLDKMKDKAGDLADKAKDAVSGIDDKAKDLAGKLDDKAEDAADKGGLLGKVAGAAHNVLDKIDGDDVPAES